jgi:hypothetical protein
LTDSLLWLLYCVGGAVAFALIFRWGWRISLSMIAGTVPTLIGWAILYLSMSEEDRPIWWRLDLSLNFSFALIFAAAGAALAFALKSRGPHS